MPEENDGLLTVSEVAEKLRVDSTTVRRWAKHGILDVVDLPHAGKRRSYRVKRSTMDTLLTATTATA